MSGKITCYLDCVSPYSYFALLYLEKNKEALATHHVDIDYRTTIATSSALELTSRSIIPVFLGGINVGSGNKPPWTLPAKAAYSSFDSARAKRYFSADDVKTPEFFPILSLLPQRALCFIKETHPTLFIPAFLDIFEAMWKNGKDVSIPEMLAEALRSRFKSEEVKTILSSANSAPFKQRLNDNTKAALERGAFGCPWFWVRNAGGAEEPFFGSDRFHYMWEYLGLPWKDVELESRATPKAKM